LKFVAEPAVVRVRRSITAELRSSARPR